MSVLILSSAKNVVILTDKTAQLEILTIKSSHMIKRFTLLLTAILVFLSVSAQSQIEINGEIHHVDTIAHAKVGPGTTQTTLYLEGPVKLRVFYLTVDLTDPTVKIRAVSAKDMLAGNETVSGMAKRKTQPGAHYFCGVNGDFFTTSGSASNGVSRVGTTSGANIVDGEIFRTSNHSQQFAISAESVPMIGRAKFYDGVATLGDKKTGFKGVNESSRSNGITLYTPRYYGITDQGGRADKCAEVTAKLVEGESFTMGRTCKFEITGTATTDGNSTIPANGYVLHGYGNTAAEGMVGAVDFVKGLKIGDIVTLQTDVKIDGHSFVPEQMVSGNPRILGDGQILDSEGERGDAVARHPRTCIGYTADKKKMIMMVVDGRSGVSAGLRTSGCAAIMKYAGASDAINVDGGGSSACYTSALGVLNHPSDGKERADGNAIFAVTSAPEDNEIAEIRFVDWAMKFPKYGMYIPKFYGYNQYGVVVSTDVQGVTLCCPQELGHIENGTKFVGDGEGTHALTATYKNCTAKIPVTIVSPKEVAARFESLILDDNRDYTIEVMAGMGNVMMPISPKAFVWSSDNESVLTVDKNTGKLTAVKDGVATVSGVHGDFTVSTKVNVQIAASSVLPVDPQMDINTWKISQAGGKMVSAEPFENGIKYVYTGAASRSAYIKFSKDLTVWSLPDAVRLRVNPGEAPVKSIVVTLSGNGLNTTSYKTGEGLTPNAENTVTVPLNEIFDTNDLQYYPVNITSINFNMGKSVGAKEYVMQIPGIEAVYPGGASVDNVLADKNVKFAVYPNPAERGESITLQCGNGKAEVKVFALTGQCVLNRSVTAENGQVQISTANLYPGVYVVSMIQDGERQNARLIVK